MEGSTQSLDGAIDSKAILDAATVGNPTRCLNDCMDDETKLNAQAIREHALVSAGSAGDLTVGSYLCTGV